MSGTVHYGSLLAATCRVLAAAAIVHTANAETLFYDLESAGPASSTVQESAAGAFDYEYPITGHIAVDLDPEAPRLTNVDSNIQLAPSLYPAISPYMWRRLHLFEGEYLTPEEEGDLSMVFRPREGFNLRAFELHVALTGDLQSLSLTGGIQQIAASPYEPDVSFDVVGGLVSAADIRVAVPEPATGLLGLLATVGLSARRR